MNHRLVLLALLMAGPTGCADQFILPANHETIDPAGATRRVLRVDGRAVECWIARSPSGAGREPEAFVLYFVGKGDRADRWIHVVASSWTGRAVELWGMNYPGSGGSGGPANLARVGPDALAVYDCLRRVAGGRPIFVHAGSFGTAAGLCVAARRPVAGLILQNPPPLKQLILGQYGWWNLWLIAGPTAAQIPADLDSIANARHSSAPAVFILSGDDEIIPPKYHQLVVDAYAGPKRVIDLPGAKHNAPLSHEAAVQLARDMDWVWGISRRE